MVYIKFNPNQINQDNTALDSSALKELEDKVRKLGSSEKSQEKQSKGNKNPLSHIWDGNNKAAVEAWTSDSLKNQTTLIYKQNEKSASKQLQKYAEKQLEAMFGKPTVAQDSVAISQAAIQGADFGGPNLEEEREELDVDDLVDEEGNSTQSSRDSVNGQRKVKRGYKIKQHIQQFKNPQQTKELIQDYAKELLQYITKGDGKTKNKVLEAHKALLESTKSAKTVSNIEGMVNQIVYEHYSYSLKQAFLRQVFNSTENQRMLLQSRFNANMMMKDVQRLIDQGVIQSTLPDLMDYIRNDLKSDLKSFLLEEAGSAMISNMSEEGMAEYKRKIDKLTQIAKESGVQISAEEINNKVMNVIDTTGLERFVRPEDEANTLDMLEGGGPGEQGSQQHKPPRYVNQEQLFEEQLREVYMLQALNPGLKNLIQLKFKMIQLKTGMYKMGVLNLKEDKRIQKEAVFLAKVRLIEMLRQAYRERATLPVESLDVKDPKVVLVRQKISDIVRQLRKLEHPIKPEVLDRIRDEENRDMYAFIMCELKQYKVAFDTNPIKALSHKCKVLDQTLTRLKEETPSCESLPEDLQLAIHRIIDVNY